jgi:hypothetical protein
MVKETNERIWVVFLNFKVKLNKKEQTVLIQTNVNSDIIIKKILWTDKSLF